MPLSNHEDMVWLKKARKYTIEGLGRLFNNRPQVEIPFEFINRLVEPFYSAIPGLAFQVS